jgi:hypothetical protein
LLYLGSREYYLQNSCVCPVHNTPSIMGGTHKTFEDWMLWSQEQKLKFLLYCIFAVTPFNSKSYLIFDFF